MAVFQFRFQPHAIDRRSRSEFDLIEVEFDTMADLLGALEAGEMVCGSLLHTRWGAERGERVVIGRRPVAFAKAAVARIDTPTWALIEQGAA